MCIVDLGLHLHTSGGSLARLFNFTIKNHILEHIAADAGALNPTWSWVFGGEDALQRVRKLVQSCSHGSQAPLVQRKVLEKYAMALSMTLA